MKKFASVIASGLLAAALCTMVSLPVHADRDGKRDEFPRYMRDPQTSEFLINEDGARIPVTNPDGSAAIGHVYRFA